MSDLLHAERLDIRVYGKPIAQGSKVANRHGGGVRDSNAKTLHAWRDHVNATAADRARHVESFTGPVRVWLRFTFERPPAHYGTGRNRNILKPDAPAYPGHGCGDIDKLTRAILDALTTTKDQAGVWADDTQVVDVRARKMYVGSDEYALTTHGVDIIIEQVAS